MIYSTASPPVVYFLIDELNAWRGTETHLNRLLTNLDRRRVTPVLGILGAHGLAWAFREAGIRVQELGVPDIGSVGGVISLIRLARVLRREQARLIVSYHTASDLIAPLLGRWVRARTVSCRRDEGFTKRRRHVILQRRLNRWVHEMISVSHAVARAVAATEGFALTRNRVIWNGEDLERFRPGHGRGIRAELGVGDTECVVTCVAGLDPVKDHSTLIRGFADALGEHPDSRLLIVGEGPERDHLLALARPKGPKVLFLGARSDVPEILRCTDIYAQTSTTEGFSNSILQAMATGLPIVTTSVGGNPEMVAASCGILVPPRNPDATAQALRALLGDASRRHRLGGAAREWAVANGSLEKMTAQYEAVFEAALSASR